MLSTGVVLVVEDDEPLGKMIGRVLTRADYQVEIATDGAAGLARIEQGGIDLVLLDVVLPGLDGLEVCRRVRSLQGPDDVYLPIIMLTGLGSETDHHAGFAVGADDYVTKPFSISLLLDRVGVWMRTRQRLRTTQAQLSIERERSRVLAEQAARDETVVVMACTVADRLAQPLAVLRGRLELARLHDLSPEYVPHVWAHLEQAVADLTERLDQLRSAARYVTRNLGSIKTIDLMKSHEHQPSSDSGR